MFIVTTMSLSFISSVSLPFPWRPGAPGTYQDLPNQSACKTCGAGRFAAGTASTECVAASAGRFVSTPGSISASDCPVGTFSATDAATDCAACNIGGVFQPAAGQTGCLSCAAGFAQGSSIECAPCASGKFNPSAKQQQCQTCFAPKFSTLFGNAGITQCQACPTGTYQQADGQSGCLPCPAGSYYSGNGCTLWYV